MWKTNYNAIYQESYNRIIEIENKKGEFFDIFYKKFISKSDKIRNKFKQTDFEIQKVIIKNSLIHLQNFYKDGVPSEKLVNIAESHSKKQLDIEPELYDLWLTSFIETLREQDPKCSKEVEQAWIKILTPGIDLIRSHYSK